MAVHAPQCPHVDQAHQYMDDVLSGAVVACKLVKLACARHKRDLERQRTEGFPYYFDPAKAERVCKIKSLMPHVKGSWARKRQRFELAPWQCFHTAVLFGWLRVGTDTRRFQEAYIQVPRKNGKSFDAAATGNYMFACDGEHGAEVYSGATSEKQAWEVFKPAREMALATPDFCYRFGVTIRTTKMEKLDDGSKFEPVVGKPGDGSSPHCAIVDEFHEHTTPDLYDTMALGMGAREQPLIYIITTAGTSLSGPCYQRYLYAISVLEGTVTDESLFAIIYTIDDGDDWTTMEAAQKANPNFGVSILPERLERDLQAAIKSAYLQNAYKTKRLNIWCGAKAAWMNMQAWQACPAPRKIKAMRGRRCYLGVDLGSTGDPSAVCLLFSPDDAAGTWEIYWKYYLPEASADDSTNAADYRAWAKQGFLELTPGNVADYEKIITDVRGIMEVYEVVEIGFDPWQAMHFATVLQAAGANMVKVPQNTQQLSEPMKLITRFVLAGKWAHGNNPVTNWMIGNTTAKEDVRGNLFPNKQSRESKIDGVSAMLNAAARAFAGQSKGHISQWLNQ